MKETEFLQIFENYRYGIEKVLPAYLNASFTDTEALVDEMALILDSRDALGAALAGAFGLRQSHLQAIDRLDEQFLSLKDQLLNLLPFYERFRQQVQPPRNHWWYYYDQIVSSQPSKPSKQSLPIYWVPLTGYGAYRVPKRRVRQLVAA